MKLNGNLEIPVVPDHFCARDKAKQCFVGRGLDAAKIGRPYCRAHRKAAECEEEARNAPDEASKTNFVQMGKAWARVAQAYEFVASLERFLVDAHKNGWPRTCPSFPKNHLPRC